MGFQVSGISNFLIVARKWIKSCDFCNNLSEQSVPWRRWWWWVGATSLNSQTAQTQRQHRRLPDKRFDTASTGGELYSNRGAVFWKDSPPWKSKVVSVGASVGALFRGRLQETHFENTKDSAAWANSNPLYKFDWPEESWEHLQVQTSWCQQSNFVVCKYGGKIGDSLSLYYRQTKNKATNELHGNELHLYYTSDPEWL